MFCSACRLFVISLLAWPGIVCVWLLCLSVFSLLVVEGTGMYVSGEWSRCIAL